MLPNTDRYINGSNFGNTTMYRCKTGYYLVSGDLIRRCDADSTWAGTNATCSSKFCLSYYCRHKCKIINCLEYKLCVCELCKQIPVFALDV